jgi:hypothetical protein
MKLDAVTTFVEAVRSIDDDGRPGTSTSVRRRPAVNEALSLAVGLGVGDSANALNEEAVVDHLRRAAHRLAVEAHYEQYPEDRPSRAEVASVQLRRRGDALADRADLLDGAEQLLVDAGDEPTTDQVIAAARALAATDAA